MADKHQRRSDDHTLEQQTNTGSSSQASHYYDVSFDFQPEASEHTPPPPITKSKPSRWDHFYEDYPKQQHQRPNTPTASTEMDEPEPSIHQDEWHYEIKGEKTVIAQSNEWLDRSLSHIKQLAQQLGHSQSETNPYKQQVEIPKVEPLTTVDKSVTNLASKWKNLFTTPAKIGLSTQELDEMDTISNNQLQEQDTNPYKLEDRELTPLTKVNNAKNQKLAARNSSDTEQQQTLAATQTTRLKEESIDSWNQLTPTTIENKNAETTFDVKIATPTAEQSQVELAHVTDILPPITSEKEDDFTQNNELDITITQKNSVMTHSETGSTQNKGSVETENVHYLNNEELSENQINITAQETPQQQIDHLLRNIHKIQEDLTYESQNTEIPALEHTSLQHVMPHVEHPETDTDANPIIASESVSTFIETTSPVDTSNELGPIPDPITVDNTLHNDTVQDFTPIIESLDPLSKTQQPETFELTMTPTPLNEAHKTTSEILESIESGRSNTDFSQTSAPIAHVQATSSVPRQLTRLETATDTQKSTVSAASGIQTSHSTLPTPDEIRAERERRRRLRVEQLVQLTDQQVRAHHSEEFSHGSPEQPFGPTAQTPESLIGTPMLTVEALHEIARHKVNQSKNDTKNFKEASLPLKETISNEHYESHHNTQSATTASDLEQTIELTHATWKNRAYTSDPSLDDTQIIRQSHYNDTVATDTMTVTELDNRLSEEDIPQAEESMLPSERNTHHKKSHNKRGSIDLSDLTGFARVAFFFNVLINVLRRFALYGLMISVLLGALAGGIGAGYFAHLVANTQPPSQQEMFTKINTLEQQSTIFYATGEPIANVRADVIRSISDLNAVSPNIINGLIATEDEHFYEHLGVMPKAILRATLQEIFSPGSGTGGSTLTQQLVKQRLLSNDVTFFRKANEILLALRLERFFSKDEILAAYLNVSPFGRDHNGNNIAGIEKAAEGIFGKKPSDVNLAQAAFLVGLPQDPYTYTPYQQTGALKENVQAGIDRMHDVLFRMYRTQKISKEEYEAALKYDITADFLPAGKPNIARQSYLYQAMENGAIEQLMRLNIEKNRLTWEQVDQNDQLYNEYYKMAVEQLRSGGYKVYTTIDKQIYDTLQTSAKQYIGELGIAYDGVHVDEETGQETYYVETVQNGLVILDNASGKVLGFVSGTDYENNQIDHAFNMRRSPGSTIKPLAVYAPAIEENIINPSTIIPDTAFKQEFNDGTTWEPTNYGNAISGGYESARVALYKSDNLPAIRIYQEMQSRSVDIIDYLTKMGFSSAAYPSSDVQNLAFSVGGVSAGPTVFEQTRAFATFANGGQYIEGYFIERIEDAAGNIVYQHQLSPVQVFNEDSNYLMVDILRDTMTEGTGRIAKGYLQVEGDWIAKSGISENSKDVWFIASTPKVTIGSWIGYDSRFANYTINIEDGYGRESERSQHYWARIVNDLHAVRPDIFGTNQTFTQPSSVTEQIVLQQTGTLPGTVQINGSTVSITGPTYKDLFKSLRSAPPLSYNFLVGANEDDLHNFWASIRNQLEAERRAREEASSSSSSDSSSSTDPNAPVENNSSTDETQSSSAE